MSLALRFLGVAGRDATHQRWQTPAWRIAQDRTDGAGKRALYLWSLQSQNENFRGPLFVLCSRPKLGWARKQLVDSSEGFSLALWCNGAGRALDWARGSRSCFELVMLLFVRDSAVSCWEPRRLGAEHIPFPVSREASEKPEKRQRSVREASQLRLSQPEGKLQSVAPGCCLPSLPCLPRLTLMLLRSQEGQQGSAGAQDHHAGPTHRLQTLKLPRGSSPVSLQMSHQPISCWRFWTDSLMASS